MSPGQIVTTSIPAFLSSFLMPNDNELTAALLAQYKERKGKENNAHAELMLIILPVDVMRGRAHFVQLRTPKKLTSNCLWQSSIGKNSDAPNKPNPALLIKISI